MHVLIIGCGYVGGRFAKDALGRGWQISALTRSEKRAQEWKEIGINPVVGDVLNSESLKNLPVADVCLYAVGFDRNSGTDKRDVYVEGLSNALNEIAQKISKLIYISSTSIYGESSGNWVDENSECEPATESGEISLAAETVVREAYPLDEQHRTATILRLSGIYGPGRLIGRKEQLIQKRPIAGNPHAWLNLIHIDDILQAIFKLIEESSTAPLYLLSDEQPNKRIDFYTELAHHLGTPEPIMPDEPSKNFGKRCDSSRIRKELELTLKQPTIREGIPASVSE